MDRGGATGAGGQGDEGVRPDASEGVPGLAALAERDYLLILDEDVRPAVLFNLEDRLGVEVWDRTRLILEIFSQHAHVKEARLQVELAMLQYEVPLIHEAVHRRRSGERPGFLGGGEYEVADYEDFIKRRMRTVKDELERIRRERDVRRKVRRSGFYLVSLAGYTNAGKSSLLNALTGAEVPERWEMFSTLQTTTRRMGVGHKSGTASGPAPYGEGDTGSAAADPANAPTNVPTNTPTDSPTAAPPDSPTPTSKGAAHPIRDRADRESAQNAYARPILLTDTVGFIQALPSWLLDAFHSTLEEIALSDVVLLVVDVSDPVELMLDKVRVAREELAFLDVTCPVLLVLNKTDLVPREVVRTKEWRLVEGGLARADLVCAGSSKTGEGIGALLARMDALFPDLIAYEASLPVGDGGQRLLSHMYGWGEILSVDYGMRMTMRGRCDPIHWKDLVSEALEIGADVTRTGRS